MKKEILNLLKNTDNFISGQELADKFNVSRTSIWKNISKLKDEGYNIISVSNRGYKLDTENGDVMNENEISYRPLQFINEVESTNDWAKTFAHDCQDGLLCTCSYQTKGKGRLGRSWVVKQDDALCMSIVIKPQIMPFDAPQLTLLAGIACVRAIKKLTGIDALIKWPNDVIINGKKVVGILTEMSAEMDWVNYIIVGIGVNINNIDFDEDIKDKATSLFLETGVKHKRSKYADTITNEFMKLYKEYCIYGFSKFKNEYNSVCANVNKRVKTVGKSEVIGKALGVNDKGEIMIQTVAGIVNIMSGEVSLRLENNKYI